MAELCSRMDGKLGPVPAAGDVGVGPVVQQKIHTSLVALLRGDQQRRGQVSCLGVHVGTLKIKQPFI